MKNRLFVTGIWALVLVLGMVLVGCPIDGGGGNNNGEGGGNDNGEKLPKSSGINAVSGKTFYERSEVKIVFSATADGAANGTYNTSVIQDGKYELGEKYKYTAFETGTYSWNEGAKTVTLKPENVDFMSSWSWIPDYTNNGNGEIYTIEVTRRASSCLDKTAYRKEVQAYVDSNKEVINQQLSSWGFSNITDYIEGWVNESFSNTTYGYSFSNDGTALFLEMKSLPANKGVNELSGQTYYGMGYLWDWEKGESVFSKDENQKYVFTASGYTHTTRTASWYNEEIEKEIEEIETEVGSYVYDSGKKRVWLRPEKINGKDRAAYYAEQTAHSRTRYADDNACRAAHTNNPFFFMYRLYNIANKTIDYDYDGYDTY
jgi:hypothetical protein